MSIDPRRRGATLFALLLPAVVAAAPSCWAQDGTPDWGLEVTAQLCPLALTPQQCLDRLSRAAGEAQGAGVGLAVEAAQAQIEKTPTSVDTFGSEIASTLKDFLPLLDGLVGIDSISDDGRELDLNLNPGLDYRPLQLTAKIRKPELYEPLEMALPEADRDTLAAAAEEMLDDTDDLEVAATYRLTRKRSREAFRYDHVFRKLVAIVPLPSIDQLQSLLQRVEAGEAFASLDHEPALEVYRRHMEERDWHRLQQLMIEAGEAIAGYQSAVETTLSQAFDGFARAVNNMSQLHASASHRFRDELAGPDLFSVRVTYELGLAGLRSLEKRLRSECGVDEESDPFAACPGDALARGLEAWSNEAADHRFSFSLEYRRADDLRVLRPGLGLDFTADTHRSLVASAAYGRRLGGAATAPRLDFQVSFEDVDDDPARRDRGTASLVLSHRLTDRMTLPLGLLYANHSRFLEGEDDKLSAHLGVRYKLQNSEAGEP